MGICSRTLLSEFKVCINKSVVVHCAKSETEGITQGHHYKKTRPSLQENVVVDVVNDLCQPKNNISIPKLNAKTSHESKHISK